MALTESPSTSSTDSGDSTQQYPLTEIDFSELNLRNVIGRGTYGSVQKAIWRGKEVAVKMINTEMEKRAFSVEVTGIASNLTQDKRVYRESYS